MKNLAQEIEILKQDFLESKSPLKLKRIIKKRIEEEFTLEDCTSILSQTTLIPADVWDSDASIGTFHTFPELLRELAIQVVEIELLRIPEVAKIVEGGTEEEQ